MEGCHALWYDNFSKIYSVKTPSLMSGSWKDCLWTGVAIHRYEGKDVDMNVRYERGAIVAAVPNLIGGTAVKVFSAINQSVQYDGEYLERSLVSTYRVSCVPLKPIGKDEDEKKRLRQSRDGMRNLLPQGLIRENIGSNFGLMRILRAFYEDRQMHIPGECQRYYVLNLDINIFNRTLKVISSILSTLIINIAT